MKWTQLLGPGAGFLAGFVVAVLLHNYPKDQVTRHRYCRVCAEYEETYREGVLLGARSESRSNFGGPVRRLLAEAVGEHAHEFTAWATIFPTFGVPPESPEIAERVRKIREIEASPRMISALEQALRHDRERATRLLQRLIDPDRDVSLAVVAELEQVEKSWEERWARVDALTRGQ